MNYVNKYIFIGVILCINLHALATIQDVYCHLLGGKDASLWYRQATKKALLDCGHSDPDQVGIKQMNALAPLCVGDDLYSFSMFNIWYNEDALDQMSEGERLFAVYHEVAHIVQKHHQQLLLSCIPAALLIALIPSMHRRLFGVQPYVIRYSAYIFWWFLSGVAIDKAWLRPWIKTQEKWADQEAARVLCSIGRQDAVDAYIASLEQQVHAGCQEPQEWHYSVKDQIAYLRTYQSKEQECVQ